MHLLRSVTAIKNPSGVDPGVSIQQTDKTISLL